ncbi:winged helix-turn-helix domain-containing protein [Teichococcus aestuarii]|uniref:winged helix-turn-helix domain-containing protein n=1 Tax=Teichococcus aestuarii TaxID=568898 RepID=UPI00361D1E5B
MESGEEIRFGGFTLLPRRKRLLREGEPVRIGQRALDLLIALAQRPGEVLDRGALLPAVWPGRHIEDSNLRAQVAALRRALGESEAEARHVLTVPGRGYSFVAPLETGPAPPFHAPPRRRRRPRCRCGCSPCWAARPISASSPGGCGSTASSASPARAASARPPWRCPSRGGWRRNTRSRRSSSTSAP